MYKEAFIPVTPFRVKDKEEYHSEPGIMKRKTNRSLSIITGATAGALAGMALGTLAGQALGKRHPGLFDGNVKRYLDTAKKTGFHPAKEYIQSHVRKHGVKPTKIPVELHAPIAGLVLGSVAGALPAEHMAIRRMEKRVGIKPTTSGEYLKKEVTPYVAGATASLVVSDGLSKILSKYPNALGIDIGEVMPLASGAAYTAAKNITRNVMDGKYKADIVNVIKGKQAGDRNMEKDIVIDKIIKIAVDLGYYGEMGEMYKAALSKDDPSSLTLNLPGMKLQTQGFSKYKPNTGLIGKLDEGKKRRRNTPIKGPGAGIRDKLASMAIDRGYSIGKTAMKPRTQKLPPVETFSESPLANAVGGMIKKKSPVKQSKLDKTFSVLKDHAKWRQRNPIGRT